MVCGHVCKDRNHFYYYREEKIKLDYVIKNYKGVYIRLNKNGRPVTCTEYERTLFEKSKAKNILNSLPKTLRRLKFKIEPISDKDIEKKVIKSESKYIIPDVINDWVEKFGICDDILKEAKNRKEELNSIISNYDKAVNNWLHEVELENKKSASGGYLKYSDIKNIVDERRKAKDEWVIINNVLKMDFRNLDREVINKAVLGLAKRKFTYRVIEEEDTENAV